MALPLVSIVITTYRRPELLARSINSILNQTYSNVEVIVVDDNDPVSDYRKKTEMVMEDFASNGRVTYVRQPRNLRQSAALNKGIKTSKGEFVGFLDDDDEFLPDKIERQIELLSEYKEDRNVGGVYCNVLKRGKGQEIATSFRKKNDEGNLLYPMLMGQVSYFGSSVLLKREVFDVVSGFNETMRRHVDLEFFSRFFNYYTLLLVEKPLVRIHIEGARNNPKAETYLQVKNDVFSAIDPYLGILTKQEYNRIYRYNYFDVSISFFANKEFFKGCKILRKALHYGWLSGKEFWLLSKIIIKNSLLRR